VTIPIGKEKEPVWPEVIVGSISHCDTLMGAIVAKKSDHVSLGLDIEEIGRVTPVLTLIFLIPWILKFPKDINSLHVLTNQSFCLNGIQNIVLK
jgi:hypothetical protein